MDEVGLNGTSETVVCTSLQRPVSTITSWIQLVHSIGIQSVERGEVNTIHQLWLHLSIHVVHLSPYQALSVCRMQQLNLGCCVWDGATTVSDVWSQENEMEEVGLNSWMGGFELKTCAHKMIITPALEANFGPVPRLQKMWCDLHIHRFWILEQASV